MQASSAVTTDTLDWRLPCEQLPSRHSGLLITLAGCGGGETTTGTSTTSGSGGRGGSASTTTGAPTTSTGGSAAMGTGGTSPNPGGATFGQSCAKNGDCASLLCVDTDGTHAVCTRACANDDACPPAPEWSCASKAGAAKVCLCQPSGEEICDGQDNDCDGVVDGKECPEPVATLMNTIADLKLSGDKLFYVTDKTIEKLDTAGGDPVVLRKDLTGIASSTSRRQPSTGSTASSTRWISSATPARTWRCRSRPPSISRSWRAPILSTRTRSASTATWPA